MSGVAALGVGQCAQIAEYPLLGVFADGAGVHDPHIRTLCGVGDGIAGLGRQAAQLLGIGFVLLAAVGLHIGQGGDGLVTPKGMYLMTEG